MKNNLQEVADGHSLLAPLQKNLIGSHSDHPHGLILMYSVVGHPHGLILMYSVVPPMSGIVFRCTDMCESIIYNYISTLIEY